MTNLSDYVVTARLREAGKWEAEIRRKDGKEMRVEGTTKLVFTTTMLVPSSGEAIGLAYQAIDSNKISVAGWI
jgi:hypothetical protein